MVPRGTVLALVVAATLVAATTASGGCGSGWLKDSKQTVWEGKLRVQQQLPTPSLNVALEFLTYFTYTRITMIPDSPVFYQLIVGQNVEDTVTCEWTCFDDKPVSNGAETRIDVTQGSVVSGNTRPFATCPSNPDDPNMQLVAQCEASTRFSMLIKPYTKGNNGSWTHYVQFLGADKPTPQPYFITCGTTGYAVQGYFRPYQPPQITSGWYKRGGTYLLLFFFAVFAGGWLYLFGSVKWNELPDLSIENEMPSDSESDEDDSEDDDDSASDSGSDSDSSGVRWMCTCAQPVRALIVCVSTANFRALSTTQKRMAAAARTLGPTLWEHARKSQQRMPRRCIVALPKPRWDFRLMCVVDWTRLVSLTGDGRCSLLTHTHGALFQSAAPSVGRPMSAATTDTGYAPATAAPAFAFHCPNCGEGVPDAAARFCRHCGQPVRAPGT